LYTERRSSIWLNLLVQANILIDQTGHARLADFGLLTIISDPANLFSSSSCGQGGTVRWMGPELIAPQDFGFKTSRPTKFSDCYSLGMVIYETISGKPPFHEDADFAVSLKVMRGERPSREDGFVDSLWKTMEQCWLSHPSSRPSIEGVLQCLEMCSNASLPSPTGTDEEMENLTLSGLSPSFSRRLQCV
jgi:serine/threonine protein kinase